MISRVVPRQRHGLLSSTSCLTKASASSPPTQRIPPFLNSPRPQRQARSLHNLPSLGPQQDEIFKDGYPGLMSAEAVHESWNIYMTHLLNRLNDLLAHGEDQANQTHDLKQLLIVSARNPAKANVFNYASMAHNHHFFMDTLSTKPNVAMSQNFGKELARHFSSINTLRETFIDTANAMFGPGYVWLVLQYRPPTTMQDNTIAAGYASGDTSANLAFRILPTYLAGSPYPGANARQQAHNVTNENLADVQARQRLNAGAFGTDRSAPDGHEDSISRWGGAHIMPLMCVSTWQHAYMQDWGVDGKKLFLQAWWDRINWEKVEQHAGSATSQYRDKHKGNQRRQSMYR